MQKHFGFIRWLMEKSGTEWRDTITENFPYEICYSSTNFSECREKNKA